MKAWNVLTIETMLPVTNLFPPHWQPAISGLMALFLTPFFILGAASIWRRCSRQRGTLIAIGFYLFLYGAVHAIWTVHIPRYFLPLLPFVISILLAGFESLRERHASWVRATFIAMALIVYAHQNVHALNYMRGEKNNPIQLPVSTYAWIRDHIPRNAVILAPNGPVIYLYTGRRCIYGHSENPGAFHQHLVRLGIDYLVSIPLGVMSMETPSGVPEQAQDIWNRIRSWAALQPDGYEPLYRNESESSVVYRVLIVDQAPGATS
jgi:hypothetical protein